MNDGNGAAPHAPAETPTALAEPREPHGSHVPVHSAPGTGGRLLVLGLLLAAGLAAAFFIRHRISSRGEAQLTSDADAAAEAPPEVDVVRVNYAPPNHVLTLPGHAEAWNETTLYARVSGYVKEWVKDIGDRVKKGEVLATISTPELDDQLEAARAKLRATEAQVAVAEADRNFAQKQFVRWKESPAGVVSPLEREEREAQFYASDAKLKAAQAQVKLDESEVKRLEDLTHFKEVRAPFDGTVTDRRIDIGDLVTAGSTLSTTSMFTVAQADRVRVFVDVPQTASTQITMGMPATAAVQEHPGSTFRGKVTHTTGAIDAAAKTLRVEVDVPNKDLTLMPGMYVQVSFESRDAKPLLRVPAAALSFRAVGPQVALVTDDGRVRFRTISIARDMGDFVEVDSGVAPDDRVALNLTSQIADGERVTPIEQQDPASPAPTTNATTLADGQGAKLNAE